MSEAAVADRETKPKVFVGSSLEGLEIAKLFRDELRPVAETVLWSEPGIFGASEFTLESLEAALDRFSYALFVLSPDDVVKSRGNEKTRPRDNVVFESGLFVGRHGRRSVFHAVPESVELTVPSDVMGFTPVKYKASGLDGVPRYDVKEACAEIARQLRSRPATSPHLRRKAPSPFWDVLSETIVILYGVEPDLDGRAHPRHRVSLRDLETAWELKTFLERRYPSKRVWPVPTTPSGWERLMQMGADLVIVGGFVTNSEFAKLSPDYEQFLRLRMGRLCNVEGQRVHFPKFAVPNGIVEPDRADPEAVEDFPTEYISRDFGFVFNGPLHIYGRDRRVVALAGVKGHGTRGAAMFVCDERRGIDARLAGRRLTSADTLELGVAADVGADAVHRTEAVTIFLNGEAVGETKRSYSVPCELGRPCEGCDFGIVRAKSHRAAGTAKIVSSTIRAIIFDLDDTLLDTFNSLIVPLEMKAAEAIVLAGVKDADQNAVASTLLRLRRANPAKLEDELRRTYPAVTRKVLTIRQRLIKDVPLHNIRISPETIEMLRRLREKFDLYLLTAGRPQFQNQKIDRLDIRRLFVETVIVKDSSASAKASAMKALLSRRGLTNESVLIVGNRLDNEIAAANALNMPSVWIKHGEGSELTPGAGTAHPDVVMGSVLEIASLLKM